MGSVLWLQYCGPHARSSTEGNGISSQSSGPKQPSNTLAPTPNSLVQGWLQQWEELWGPSCKDHGSEGHRYQAPAQSSSSTVHMDTRPSDDQAHAGTAAGWTVPDVVIDPVLHAGGELSESVPPPVASPALSTTSTLRGRDQPSLPSLKASGLLEVSIDDASGRHSGASTPTKPAPPWPLSTSASPRAPLLSPGHSPGLSVPSPSALQVGTPLSSLPSPGPSQVHMSAAEIYPRGSPLPSPGLLAAPSSFPEGGAVAQVSRHTQDQTYFESSSSPHGHMHASHGADAPPARR